MILVLIFFSLFHPYIKKESLEVDSAFFYKVKLRKIVEQRTSFDFPIEEKDSLFILKVKMFRDLKKGVDEEYYKYVIKKDFFMNLLYLFKKGFYKRVYEVLKEKKGTRPEYYLLYLLSALKLKNEPLLLNTLYFRESPYYPYIAYLTSLFLFLKGEYLEVIEMLEKVDNSFLMEDKDFLLSLSFFNKYHSIKKFEEYIKKYGENFYTDTLYFIVGNYYYNRKKYKNSLVYFKKLVDKKGRFYKSSLKFLIELESLIGKKGKKLLEDYEKEFGKDEIFIELIKKSIFNFYARKHFKEVIEIYERWGYLVKEKTFAAYISSLLRVGDKNLAFEKIREEKDKFLKGVGYFKVGEYYEINKDYWSAIRYYNISLKYLGEEGEFSQNIFLKKLLLEVKVGKIPNIKVAYHIFIKEFPESADKPRLLREIVDYLLKEGKLEEAFIYQKEVFELEKERADFAKLLDMAFLLENYEFLDSIYMNVQDEFKDIAGFYLAKFIYKKKRNLFDAFSLFKEIIEKSAENEYGRLAKYYVGEIYKALGKIEEAEEILLSISGGEDTVSFNSVILLSEIYKEKGEIEKMEELLAKSSLKWEGEKKGHILFRLAEVKEIKGEIEEAKDIYLLSAENLFPCLDSVALALYKSAGLTNLKEEKKALLERAKNLAQNLLFKKEIEKSLVDLE